MMQRSGEKNRKTRLSVVIPCFNERGTLRQCVEKVISIGDSELALEIIIVDDSSTDGSYEVAFELLERYPQQVVVLRHKKNQGKGAALRTGFAKATGDFVCVQDADLEYDPSDLKRLLGPLVSGKADVVLGSRFLATGEHRVLYFWHYLGNRFLTLISNMFTDLNLTDMETGYKVFRRDVLQKITIEEDRFGFEPEIVAKIAHMRIRIYETGISYYGRTYAEGKKIGPRDGLRALYCIMRYNLHRAPPPVQFIAYLFIGGVSGLANLALFLGALALGYSPAVSALCAFFLAAAFNYVLCILLLFRHKARWNAPKEIAIYLFVVCAVGILDVGMTKSLMEAGFAPYMAKCTATLVGLILNFAGRRLLVFPEASSGPWKQRHEEIGPEKALPESER
ncbi:MAG: glycosyltransferase [Syntrophobacteraceae bacterium]|jgi:glycosyltransferase involved in cell wall biosynthesis